GQHQRIGCGEDHACVGAVAQSSSGVDGLADVVVALEDDDRAGGDAGAHLQFTDVAHLVADGDDSSGDRLDVDTDEHDAVAQPLVDAHAEQRRGGAHAGAQLHELGYGRVVAV